MIFAETISELEYTKALRGFQVESPRRAWVLAPKPRGRKWHLPKYNVYLGIRDDCFRCPNTVEVTGVFRRGDGLPGAAVAVVDLCRTIGVKTIIMDYFEPVAKVWRDVGFIEWDRQAFNREHAPELWLPEYGEPDVVYSQLSVKNLVQ